MTLNPYQAPTTMDGGDLTAPPATDDASTVGQAWSRGLRGLTRGYMWMVIGIIGCIGFSLSMGLPCLLLGAGELGLGTLRLASPRTRFRTLLILSLVLQIISFFATPSLVLDFLSDERLANGFRRLMGASMLAAYLISQAINLIVLDFWAKEFRVPCNRGTIAGAVISLACAAALVSVSAPTRAPAPIVVILLALLLSSICAAWSTWMSGIAARQLADPNMLADAR